MIQHQVSKSTQYNRYPDIFRDVANIINKPCNILSFGCSDGTEIKTLREIYFPDSNYFGCDIDPINCAPFIHADELPTFYRIFDCIFAMSVLCRYPQDGDEYTFDSFEKQLIILDRVLKTGGIIVIHNSNYRFSDTCVYQNYMAIESKHMGFVPIYDKEGNRCEYYETIFIKKK